jgi:class 3 adenylate cyclase
MPAWPPLQQATRSRQRWKQSKQCVGLRALGEPPLEIVVALHIGPAMYGNIGAADRLDFTVIGPAVNLGRVLIKCADRGRSAFGGEPDILCPY